MPGRLASPNRFQFLPASVSFLNFADSAAGVSISRNETTPNLTPGDSLVIERKTKNTKNKKPAQNNARYAPRKQTTKMREKKKKKFLN